MNHRTMSERSYHGATSRSFWLVHLLTLFVIIHLHLHFYHFKSSGILFFNFFYLNILISVSLMPL